MFYKPINDMDKEELIQLVENLKKDLREKKYQWEHANTDERIEKLLKQIEYAREATKHWIWKYERDIDGKKKETVNPVLKFRYDKGAMVIYISVKTDCPYENIYKAWEYITKKSDEYLKYLNINNPSIEQLTLDSIEIQRGAWVANFEYNAYK